MTVQDTHTHTHTHIYIFKATKQQLNPLIAELLYILSAM